MKLSFATLGCPGWDLERIVGQARAIGFYSVELRGIKGEHLGPDESPEFLEQLRSRFRSNGIAVAAIMGYSSFTMSDPVVRKEQLNIARKFLLTARRLECPILRLFGGRQEADGRGPALKRLVAGLKELVPDAEQAGVRLALETHDDWVVGANARAVMEGVGSPRVGICWDLANSWYAEPMEKTFTAIQDHVIHVHFKDSHRLADGSIHSCLPGKGDVDLYRGMDLLKGIGYQGYLSFEWEKRWEPDLEDPEIAFPHYRRFTRDLMKRCGVSG